MKKLFLKSVERELGKNTGKLISNLVFGDGHSTPHRIVYNKEKNTIEKKKIKLREDQQKIREQKQKKEYELKLLRERNRNEREISKQREKEEKEYQKKLNQIQKEELIRKNLNVVAEHEEYLNQTIKIHCNFFEHIDIFKHYTYKVIEDEYKYFSEKLCPSDSKLHLNFEEILKRLIPIGYEYSEDEFGWNDNSRYTNILNNFFSSQYDFSTFYFFEAWDDTKSEHFEGYDPRDGSWDLINSFTLDDEYPGFILLNISFQLFWGVLENYLDKFKDAKLAYFRNVMRVGYENYFEAHDINIDFSLNPIVRDYIFYYLADDIKIFNEEGVLDINVLMSKLNRNMDIFFKNLHSGKNENIPSDEVDVISDFMKKNKIRFIEEFRNDISYINEKISKQSEVFSEHTIKNTDLLNSEKIEDIIGAVDTLNKNDFDFLGEIVSPFNINYLMLEVENKLCVILNGNFKEVIPKEKPYLINNNQTLKYKNIPTKEYFDLQQDFIYSIVLSCSKQIFDNFSGVDSIVFEVRMEVLDSSYGKNVLKPIIQTETSREDIESIDTFHVDPSDFFERIGVVCEFSSTRGFSVLN